MDSSTILIVFLLVTAATLASLALSHWSSLRGALGFSWAALSVGTTMLLAAAAIVVLTFVFRGLLWRPDPGAEQQVRERGAAPKETLAHPFTTASLLPPLEAAPADQRPLQAATTPSTTELDPDPLGFKEGNPWAATRCVHVYHPGSDPNVWKIENGCGVPVGVIVSSCSAGAQECDPGRQVILPAKSQRPVPLDEQTVYGDVHYVACYVATPTARNLIGAPSEERATAEWREQFESIRVDDGCLSQVQSWSDESRRTRLPIDRLVGYGGNNVP